MSLTPVRLAASISITSTWRSSAIAMQLSHWPQGSAVGPPLPSGPVQLSARAMMRAVVVLPTPRTPVSMKACARRPAAMALVRVRTIASWPMTSAKLRGRYLRARTRYGAAVSAAGMADRRLLKISYRASRRCARAVQESLEVGGWQTTRAETRYGCFLPDLTGLARRPSAANLPKALYQVSTRREQPRRGGPNRRENSGG